jgi:hypothetical protein
MEYEDPLYCYPLHWINQTEGPGHPAGIYLLDGRTRLAARHSLAERALLEAGALYVATLVFGPSPFEARFPGHPVRAVAPREMVAWCAGASN